MLESEVTSLEVTWFKASLLAMVYAKFSARLNDPRSFWIFSCSSVMA